MAKARNTETTAPPAPEGSTARLEDQIETAAAAPPAAPPAAVAGDAATNVTELSWSPGYTPEVHYVEPQIGSPEELVQAARDAGEYDPTDDYEERPLADALSDTRKAELVQRGWAEGEGSKFKLLVPESLI